jgi:hypothetical protein
VTKADRAALANAFIEAIASCGRKFFFHNGRASRFEVDARGRVWFIDAYSEHRIYTHYGYRWRGFSEGGTLRSLVEKLRDFIRTGDLRELHLGPWPKWICDGDLWGYGEDMAKVREAAEPLAAQRR